MTMFSVLLSVYSKEDPSFLNSALESIYSEQTLIPSQIVLVKDGNLTNELDSVIDNWHRKIGDIFTIVSLEENQGLGSALNEGLVHCQYDLVARMDSDDIALPDRFAKQVVFMENNPEVAASSGMIEEWNESLSIRLGTRNLPTESNQLIRFAKTRSPLSHPATIFRKSAIIEVGGYPPLRKAQDYALWSLLLTKNYKLSNLPDVLLKMRTGKELFSRRGLDYLREEYRLLRFQKKIGFLSTREYLINIILKSGLRLAPRQLKQWAYRYVR